MIDKLKKRKEILRDSALGQDQALILTSSLNAESQMKFLNIWRPVLQTMLYIISKRRKTSVESTLSVLTNYYRIKDEKYDVILDVFGMQQMKPDGEIVQLLLPNDPLQFVKREVYAEETVDSILDFIIGFIKIVLGDEQSFSEEFQSQSKSSVSAAGNPLGLTHGEPLLVVLDTVHLMDEPSWRLLELIKDECYRIGILLLVQTDTNNTIKIHPDARSFYEETFGTNH